MRQRHRALAARTEGWAAGLQLAALSLRGQDDAAAFVAAFTGSHRYVLDYLAEEVLEGQDKQLRTFLLETSVLERLSGPLCDAVTGRGGSQELLEEAERAGLFLIPLDEVRGWWRYHHLFADLLRARLQEEQPGRVPTLHRNAAAWYAGCGLADDAIGHAVAAGEMLWAARIIEQQFDMVYNIRGEAATIHRWLSVLPADVVRSRPRLLLAQAIMAATSGHVEVVEPLLDAVECAPPDWTDEPFEPTAGIAASHLINVPATTGPPGRGRADLRAGSGRPRHRRPLLPAAGPGYVGLADIAYQRDELDTALRYATEGIALCRQFVYTPPLANGLATLAMIRQATGDPAGALEAITEAEQASPGPAGLLNPVPAQRARLLLA